MLEEDSIGDIINKMKYTDNIYYIVTLFDEVLNDLKQHQLFTNKNFTILGKKYEDNIIFTLVKKNTIRLDIFINEDSLEIHIDKTAETFVYSLEMIKNNEQHIKNVLKMIFTSKIKVKYCGKNYTKIYFIINNEVLNTFVFRKGLSFFKQKCNKKIYPPIFGEL